MADGDARGALAARHGAASPGAEMGITSSPDPGPRGASPDGAVMNRVPERGETGGSMVCRWVSRERRRDLCLWRHHGARAAGEAAMAEANDGDA